ncbi:hypothetical protein BEP19_00335 [Ammoniphilus oxalaticus]|uniref:Protein CotJB domain-containing protein n=1 Tax=Ammoniphilus oxalaticus TaxID=66863 RepID=A0A419SR85_9BACL|nr:spore coat protein CotJB [Ammoniphilus oxalaticus]RKD27056.1 hypothetical protein BEP19_00335 [Ammoniphilus oxalaticus]
MGNKNARAEESVCVDDIAQVCEQLRAEIRTTQRAMIDLMLYLDTHPLDHSARQQYTAWQSHWAGLKQKYEQSCGPLGWYGPRWWERALGYGYDPLDDCFENRP